jgi:hypothetical protein
MIERLGQIAVILFDGKWQVNITLEDQEIVTIESVSTLRHAGANEERSSKVIPRPKTANGDMSESSILLSFNKVEPINFRNPSRSRAAIPDRSFSTTAATLSLPLIRLTSHRVCAMAESLLFVLGELLRSLVENL